MFRKSVIVRELVVDKLSPEAAPIRKKAGNFKNETARFFSFD